MKKILLLIAALIPLLLMAESEQITNFDDFLSALKQGEEIKIVIDYGVCEMISGNEIKEAPKAIGGLKINAWEFFSKGMMRNEHAFVAFSKTNLINIRGFVFNYVKFKIKDDDSVKITAQYANTDDYSLEMNENFFTEINDGKNEAGLSIYKLK